MFALQTYALHYDPKEDSSAGKNMSNQSRMNSKNNSKLFHFFYTHKPYKYFSETDFDPALQEKSIVTLTVEARYGSQRGKEDLNYIIVIFK